jgi:hypothetical protein
MLNSLPSGRHIRYVTSFQELVSMPFEGEVNAMCWPREMQGDFAEIAHQLRPSGNMATIEPEELEALRLSQEGELARRTLLDDLRMLTAHGASPVLNVIDHYDRDDSYALFPTDVYSFHVDRSPVPTETFLCTYHGEPSELLANAHARQKVLIPELRAELRKLYDGEEEGFEAFLVQHFFDLHYQPAPDAIPQRLGVGHLWKLAVDHPESRVLPCVHRAPLETSGQPRLLLIC